MFDLRVGIITKPKDFRGMRRSMSKQFAPPCFPRKMEHLLPALLGKLVRQKAGNFMLDTLPRAQANQRHYEKSLPTTQIHGANGDRYRRDPHHPSVCPAYR
jgi:hypothetical protein